MPEHHFRSQQVTKNGNERRTLFDDILNSRPWQVNALCAKSTDPEGNDIDPDWWFPSRDTSERIATESAKKVCMVCPVRAECLIEITENPTYGTWAGYTERERSELKIGKRLP